MLRKWIHFKEANCKTVEPIKKGIAIITADSRYGYSNNPINILRRPTLTKCRSFADLKKWYVNDKNWHAKNNKIMNSCVFNKNVIIAGFNSLRNRNTSLTNGINIFHMVEKFPILCKVENLFFIDNCNGFIEQFAARKILLPTNPNIFIIDEGHLEKIRPIYSRFGNKKKLWEFRTEYIINHINTNFYEEEIIVDHEKMLLTNQPKIY